jgi:cellulase
MSCYTLKVTGGGSTSPSTVKLPGAYTATDPGILFDLYSSFTSYTIPGTFCSNNQQSKLGKKYDHDRLRPDLHQIYVNIDPITNLLSLTGPAVFTCGSSGSTGVATTPASPTTAVTTAPSTTAPSTSAAPTTTAVVTGGSPLYGQCGGSGW